MLDTPVYFISAPARAAWNFRSAEWCLTNIPHLSAHIWSVRDRSATTFEWYS